MKWERVTGDFWRDLQFDTSGLLPAVVQENSTGEVLMLAYMNRQSLQKTLETGQTWFYSRSRQELWHKGATSGHYQGVESVYYDCDGDTLLIKVCQTGGACHEGYHSCFYRKLDGQGQVVVQGEATPKLAAMFAEVFQVIKDRQANLPEGSYTSYLFCQGQDKILKKVGEEAAETIIGSKNQQLAEVSYEMADLFYHCLVLLAYHGLTPDNIAGELAKRR